LVYATNIGVGISAKIATVDSLKNRVIFECYMKFFQIPDTDKIYAIKRVLITRGILEFSWIEVFGKSLLFQRFRGPQHVVFLIISLQSRLAKTINQKISVSLIFVRESICKTLEGELWIYPADIFTYSAGFLFLA